ncbi:MAG: DNA-binding protein, partial [Magnetospirillum sp.]|nr:DNA-binding protein [Magnetospirillum sp.]
RGHAPEATKTHGAVHSAFALEFVKTGQIPREIGRALGQVQDIRLLADYAAEPVPLEKAEWSVVQAAAFVAAVRDLLS